MQDIQLVEHYIKRRVAESQLYQQPFNFMYIENIFPDDFFQYLISIAPPKEFFVPLGSKRHDAMVKIKRGRDVCSIHSPDQGFINDIPDRGRLLWLYRWFSSFIKPLFANKFSIKLDPHIETLRFVCDSEGYSKKPHTDVPQKIISLLFYLSDCSRGTSILVPKDKTFTDMNGYDHDYSLFDSVFETTFQHNSLLVMQRSDNSFHCVYPYEDITPRLAIHYDIRHAKSGLVTYQNSR